KYRKSRSTEIAERLLEELARLGDPDQDNISFTVIKVNDASTRPKQDLARPSMAVARPKRLTTLATEPIFVHKPPRTLAPPAEPPQPEPPPLKDGKARAEEARATPRRVVIETAEPADKDLGDLTPVRLRPKRVIVIK
ncbi:hypothetical protein ACFOD6_22010, partial [Tabrizicola soli]